MEKNRIISCILAGIATAAFLTACGSNKTTTSGASEISSSQTENQSSADGGSTSGTYADGSYVFPKDDKMYLGFEYVKSLVNINDYRDYSSDLQGSEGKKYPRSIELSDENKKDYDYDPSSISLDDGTTIKLPCTVKELESLGWSCDDEAKEKSIEPVSDSGFFTNAHGLNITFQNSQKKYISVGIYNFDKSNAKKAADCTCTRLTLGNDYKDPKFSTKDNLDNNITLDKIIEKFGEPSKISFSGDTGEIGVDFISKRDDGNCIGCKFKYDSATNATELYSISFETGV